MRKQAFEGRWKGDASSSHEEGGVDSGSRGEETGCSAGFLRFLHRDLGDHA